ncbi:MAG: Holliday junction ATP-dependent DNA helicase RuvB [candidate division BRC1 bacterium ADurb.BinA364]|nr:MAG: Holliday junction ATP-dependent DNA helicase RuvB [candidate division BRC1 bacterium ADurb.BinA364]
MNPHDFRPDPEDEPLRPNRFDDFIGQGKCKENLRLFVEAARKRKEALDHTLLYGPPGLGKTTLALLIANEMGVNVKSTTGPVIERKDELAAMLTDLNEGDVLFIDEIHRLNRLVEELLYPALEDFKIDVMIGEGPHAKSIQLDLPRFTLVGATTRLGMISGPLRSRFGIVERVDFYTREDMAAIVRRSSRILNVAVDEGGERQIAARARGTPRFANRMLRRVRDFAEVRGDGVISSEVADQALTMFGIDSLGLDPGDLSYLKALTQKFGGGPVGLNTIAVALNEDEDTIQDVVEPFLIQIGFLNRTPRGRIATPLAYEHLKIAPPREGWQDSFL